MTNLAAPPPRSIPVEAVRYPFIPDRFAFMPDRFAFIPDRFAWGRAAAHLHTNLPTRTSPGFAPPAPLPDSPLSDSADDDVLRTVCFPLPRTAGQAPQGHRRREATIEAVMIKVDYCHGSRLITVMIKVDYCHDQASVCAGQETLQAPQGHRRREKAYLASQSKIVHLGLLLRRHSCRWVLNACVYDTSYTYLYGVFLYVHVHKNLHVDMCTHIYIYSHTS